ncbi:LysM peptidoglycan-binding domain-containing protein [Chungangia koreensis]|uniref:LysM peptidoglycan-binding domain-containing protein n=1 Tax=Chungangia koreensis TaxID=752657 RepID=A0ABV8X4Y5_9LACT
MKPDDYLEKIEQHRQEIHVDKNGEDRVRSRRELHRNGRKNGKGKTPKKKTSKLLTTMFGIFILIPVGFLIYVVAFYEPQMPETALKDNQFKMEVNTPDQDSASDSDEVDPPSDENENIDAEQPETDSTTVPAQPEENVDPAPVEDEPEKTEETDAEERTHVVAPGETLFRIAMNYYGSPDGVETIKSANGLSSNEISAGQTLRIP